MKKTWNVSGKLIDLSTPKVMGIINVTPDSFYKGSRSPHVEQGVAMAATMLEEGATFLDLGGYSSRPGANDISIAEEIERVVPVVEAIAKAFPGAIMSIDTFRSEVAEAALNSGARIINDITAATADPKMIDICLMYQAPIILMHMRGTPQTMSSMTNYSNLVTEVIRYLADRVSELGQRNVTDMAVDPGFGFAKTAEQGFAMLDQLEHFSRLDQPLLVGLSRKSMIWRTLETTADHALNGTSALNTIALMKGADILRVHDVRPAMECARLVNKLTASRQR